MPELGKEHNTFHTEMQLRLSGTCLYHNAQGSNSLLDKLAKFKPDRKGTC